VIVAAAAVGIRSVFVGAESPVVSEAVVARVATAPATKVDGASLLMTSEYPLVPRLCVLARHGEDSYAM
jgi:hypothetical protein